MADRAVLELECHARALIERGHGGVVIEGSGKGAVEGVKIILIGRH